MKPKAPQRWTYAQPQPQSSAEAEPQPADEAVAPVEPTAEVSELDGILEHRWAVND
jgi:hypothetical protein